MDIFWNCTLYFYGQPPTVNTKLQHSLGGDKINMSLLFLYYRFSGITEKMLGNVTTTLPDVQKHLIDLLPEDAILLGHSLEFDLRALKVGLQSVQCVVPGISTPILWRVSGNSKGKEF